MAHALPPTALCATARCYTYAGPDEVLDGVASGVLPLRWRRLIDIDQAVAKLEAAVFHTYVLNSKRTPIDIDRAVYLMDKGLWSEVLADKPDEKDPQVWY